MDSKVEKPTIVGNCGGEEAGKRNFQRRLKGRGMGLWRSALPRICCKSRLWIKAYGKPSNRFNQELLRRDFWIVR